MSNHKILIVSTAYTMKSGLSWSLVGFTSVYKEKGVDFCVLLPRHGDLEENLIKNNIPCRIIPYYTVGWYTSGRPLSVLAKCKDAVKKCLNYVALNRIVKLIKKEKYTIVHINALTDDIGAKAAKAANVKYVWHIREFMEEDLGIHFCDPERAHLEMNSAACMIAISGEIKKKFQPLVKNEIKVVYNGIDVQRFYKERDIFTKDYVSICMVGRISPQKGQMQLSDAVIKLYAMGHQNLRVQFIGDVRDKAYVETIKQRIAAANLTDVFEFISFTKQVEVYYQASDIVCVCSSKEAFGRVTVEGMVSGALVIGAKSGGTLELIEDGVTGFFYQNSADSLASVLENVLKNREEAKRIAKTGQKWASERFTARKNAEGILAIYNNV